jgi:hypothetical protein
LNFFVKTVFFYIYQFFVFRKGVLRSCLF